MYTSGKYCLIDTSWLIFDKMSDLYYNMIKIFILGNIMVKHRKGENTPILLLFTDNKSILQSMK